MAWTDDVGTTEEQLKKKQAEEVIREAHERFERCEAYESAARALWLDDLKFANADSDNKFQWPDTIYKQRTDADRPCLTVNKTRQHNLNILNDMRQNKPGIKIVPMGSGSSYKSAQAYSGLIRSIEARSKASVAYMTAAEFAITAGYGVIRVDTQYVDERSFDQDIVIKRVTNPLMVYFDPDAQELDKSDGRFAFMWEDVPKDLFEKKYPKYKGKGVLNGALNNNAWTQEETVRVAEYWRFVEHEDEIFMAADGTVISKLQVEAKAQDWKVLTAPGPDGMPAVTRKTSWKVLEWYLIVGEEIVEGPLMRPGKYIPLVPVVGEEIVIEGRLDRRGHTRAMKDPQRMYNYWTSSAVEYGALQTKTPWITPIEAVDGLENYWERANDANTAYLPYNAFDEDHPERPLPPPQKVQPPQASSVALAGMQAASLELEMTSGQYAQQMGMPGNERTGKAINERQKQGDKSTYHFIDNLAVALRHVGVIILDLVPYIYDTERLMMIVGEDGTTRQMKVDPEAEEAFQPGEDDEMGEQQEPDIFNPLKGRYEVSVDVGPNYASKREEAFDAFTLMLTQSPAIAGVLGDLLFQAADFPMADEAAARLKRMVPPQALGKGPSPTEQQLQMQVQNLTNLVQELVGQLTEHKIKEKAREEENDVRAYDAVTKRMDVIAKDQIANAQLQAQTLLDAMEISLAGNTTSGGEPKEGDLAAQGQLPLGMPTSIPGARRDPSGSWQVREPGGTYSPVGQIMGPNAGAGAPPKEQ